MSKVTVAGKSASRPSRSDGHSRMNGHTYFFNELVTSVSTSWFSSRSKLVARWPRRLSAKRGDASSFRHSIWPKCVRSPRVNRYRSLATLLRLWMCHCQPKNGRGAQVGAPEAYRILWSCVSSRKLARIAALSFWMTALSSAIVLAARTLRMNCFTATQPV